MAQTYFPFDSGQGADVKENQWSDMAQHWLETGVIKGKLNQLQVYADSTGMQVKVKSGQAWLKGHFFESDAEEVLPISTADATNSRIDRVIVRLDWTANTILLAILQGIPAVSPVAPALTQNTSRWEISLAQILVSANVSTIASGNVTDERFPTGFNTPTFFNGWVANSPSYPPRYWKDSAGMVHFRMWLKDGASGLNVVVMNFPDGYRPIVNDVYSGANDSTTNPNIIYHITTGGEMKFLKAFTAGASITLNGSFKAGN
ncbi:hypothetical protein FB550_102418 [Neobacillus bataviensis]|uniref:Uncharacterized protein n=1 Tax=Neobacillus bataviensis TaxID=220685 RepID=A0A561DSR9_9BACI|nr:hypothetical protein [Neobacillus bataviensis]TWE06396.1 hypothetical protein FB550_102418 [Neobacillus bataviensis]